MSSITVEQLEQKVIRILADLAKRAPEDLSPQDSLIDDLGIDSIQFLELFATLEEEFGFELEVNDLRPELFRSVRSVFEFVQGRVAP
jgi:acyl carrier protein